MLRPSPLTTSSLDTRHLAILPPALGLLDFATETKRRPVVLDSTACDRARRVRSPALSKSQSAAAAEKPQGAQGSVDTFRARKDLCDAPSGPSWRLLPRRRPLK